MPCSVEDPSDTRGLPARLAIVRTPSTPRTEPTSVPLLPGAGKPRHLPAEHQRSGDRHRLLPQQLRSQQRFRPLPGWANHHLRRPRQHSDHPCRHQHRRAISPATTTAPARRRSCSTSRKASCAPPMERSPPSETRRPRPVPRASGPSRSPSTWPAKSSETIPMSRWPRWYFCARRPGSSSPSA